MIYDDTLTIKQNMVKFNKQLKILLEKGVENDYGCTVTNFDNIEKGGILRHFHCGRLIANFLSTSKYLEGYEVMAIEQPRRNERIIRINNHQNLTVCVMYLSFSSVSHSSYNKYSNFGGAIKSVSVSKDFDTKRLMKDVVGEFVTKQQDKKQKEYFEDMDFLRELKERLHVAGLTYQQLDNLIKFASNSRRGIKECQKAALAEFFPEMVF